MRNLELGNETEKDVFNLVTSAEQREKSRASQWVRPSDSRIQRSSTEPLDSFNKKWFNNRFMTTWINLQIYTKGVAGVFKGDGGGGRVLHWIKQRVITSFCHLNIASCASCLLTKGGGGCHGYKHLYSFLILKSTSHLQWEPVAFCLYFFPQKHYHN